MKKREIYRITPGNKRFIGVETEGEDVVISFKAFREEKNAVVFLDENTGEEIESHFLDDTFFNGNLASVRINDYFKKPCGYLLETNGKRRKDETARLIKDGICFVPKNEDILKEDKSPGIKPSDRMIYKLHVKGFTMLSNGIKSQKGTFQAFSEKLDYIAKLGFNTIELMPCYEWETKEKNYWGYTAINYFYSPKSDYVSGDDGVCELKNLIKKLHLKGLLCYMEFHIPYGTDALLILDALHYWIDEYHIDGFHFLGNGVMRDMILSDPYLRRAALTFEYVDERRMSFEPVTKEPSVYSEDEHYQQTARAFLRGESGKLAEFVSLMLKHRGNYLPINSISNVNGFTLRDLVSYNEKHNEENGENNRDGTDYNVSWNCGVEGPTNKTKIRALRYRQMKNALAYLFLSQGNPLLMAGDERGRTQLGNNNAYASDNPNGYVPWKKSKYADALQRYVKELIAFRKSHVILHNTRPFRENDEKSLGCPDVSFHDKQLWYSYFENERLSIGLLYNESYADDEEKKGKLLFAAFNADGNDRKICLPKPPKGQHWETRLDTAAPAGDEFLVRKFESVEGSLVIKSRSVFVLESETDGEENVVLEQDEIC